MPNTIFLSQPSTATAALFRDWGSKLSAALATVGFVKTADTGTIDWATVGAPSSPNQMMGFEMWRFNDSLQSTYPLYFKLEYGSSTSNAAYWGMYVTVGAGTDGSGTIQQALTNRFGVVSTAANPGYDLRCFVTSGGGGSMLGVAMFPALASQTVSRFFGFERSCDTAGTYNGNGVFTLAKTASGSQWYQYTANYAAKTYTGLGYAPVTHPNYQALGINGSNPISCLVTGYPGYVWQPRMAVAGHNIDMGWASETVFTIPGFGQYLNTGLSNLDAYSSNTAVNLGMLWS